MSKELFSAYKKLLGKSPQEFSAKMLNSDDVAAATLYACDFTYLEKMLDTLLEQDFILKPVSLPRAKVFVETTNNSEMFFNKFFPKPIFEGFYIEELPSGLFKYAYVIQDSNGRPDISPAIEADFQPWTMGTDGSKSISEELTYNEYISYLQKLKNEIHAFNPNNERHVAKASVGWASVLAMLFLVVFQRTPQVAIGTSYFSSRGSGGKRNTIQKDFKVLNLDRKVTRVGREAVGKRTIEWKYHIKIAGYFRTYKDRPQFQGKDRDGLRNQLGRTWVNEHLKGDIKLPLAVARPTLMILPQASNE